MVQDKNINLCTVPSIRPHSTCIYNGHAGCIHHKCETGQQKARTAFARQDAALQNM